MSPNRKKVLASVVGILAFAAVFMLATPTKAEASFIAYICNDAACTGGGDFLVTDGTAPDVTLDGFINFTVCASGCTFTGTVGGLDITSDTARSKPQAGSSVLTPGMDLGYTASGIGTAWIYASDTGFLGNGLMEGENGGTLGGGTLTTILCGGNSNTNLDLTNCTNVNGFGPIANGFPTAFPYSLTLGVKIVRTVAAGTTSGDFLVDVQTVPEPASLTLLGLGLAGIAGAGRRRWLARKQ